MPSSYAKNKIHIYNYVDTHREKYNTYQNEYKMSNRDKYNAISSNYYSYKKSCNYEAECKRFRKICL